MEITEPFKEKREDILRVAAFHGARLGPWLLGMSVNPVTLTF